MITISKGLIYGVFSIYHCFIGCIRIYSITVSFRVSIKASYRSKLYALISEKVLSNLAKIPNGNIEYSARDILKGLGAKLVSITHAFPIFFNYEKKDAINIAQQLNLIANTRKDLDKNWLKNINGAIKVLNKYKKIISSYSF